MRAGYFLAVFFVSALAVFLVLGEVDVSIKGGNGNAGYPSGMPIGEILTYSIASGLILAFLAGKIRTRRKFHKNRYPLKTPKARQ